MVITELSLGVRLALGGRSGRSRTALTVIGVGLGVAVLLLAASLPHVLSARDLRAQARQPIYGTHGRLRLQETDTAFRGSDISGVTLQAAGAGAPIPPGIDAVPGPGQMDVSPALAAMLRGPSGADLRRRLGARVVGTIQPAGLREPAEAFFYRGSALPARLGLPADVIGFGSRIPTSATSPVTTLMTIVLLVGLLLPVAVFVFGATRFGAEERQERLAALRLIGADLPMTVWVVVGEALLSAGTGLLLGGGLFFLARPLAQSLDVAGLSVYRSDIQPSSVLAVLIVVLIPMSAVLATLFSVRRVLADPIGVSRRGRSPARRLWWRLIAPAVGFALLIALGRGGTRLSGSTDEAQAAVGMVLVLIGVATLLPWVVEAFVRRVPTGRVSWLLAIRRLHNEGGVTVRVVGAIALTVAGAIALQMLFGAAQASLGQETGPYASNAISVTLHVGDLRGADADIAALERAGAATLVARDGFAQADAYSGRSTGGRTYTAVFELPAGPGDPSDRFRDRAAQLDPLAELTTTSDLSELSTLRGLRRGLAGGAVVVLLMVGASLLVAIAEQVRQRRRSLADLRAIGVDRATVAWSVLWQATIPVIAGLVIAVGLGIGLGLVLSAIVHLTPQIDWGTIGLLSASAVLVVAAVTALSLPTLWRSMSAQPLWTE